MTDRETKTIAETTNQELLDELAARSETLVVGVVFHADPETWWTRVGGSRLAAVGLARDVTIAADRHLKRATDEG